MSMPKMLKFKGFKPVQPVIIRTLSNGYTAEVGCKSFVVGDLDDLMVELHAYLKGDRTGFNELYKGELATSTIHVTSEECDVREPPDPRPPAPGLGQVG